MRLERRDDPTIIEPTDAIIRLPATCICGSDLWPYRGIEPVDGPAPMGHEYVGIVEAVGKAVTAGDQLFFSHTHLHGGPAPVRRFLPDLIDLIWNREINPGKVFDLALPLDQVAEGYRAMDERRAIKTLLRP
jgi:threonine dehydrogenase-like Zn-dependent dehydrogenase